MYLLSLYHIYIFYAIYPTGATTIVQLPLAFVRSGGTYLDNGYTGSLGLGSYYWSCTSKAAINAYGLNLNTTDVDPSSTNMRFAGRPLRCRTSFFLH